MALGSLAHCHDDLFVNVNNLFTTILPGFELGLTYSGDTDLANCVSGSAE